MQTDPKLIDEYVDRICRDYEGHEVTVPLVASIAGRSIATAMNEFSKVPEVTRTVEGILETIEEIKKSVVHSNGNVKLMISLFKGCLEHNKMSDSCRLESQEIIKAYLEETEGSLVNKMKVVIEDVWQTKKEDGKFWMSFIKWLAYMIPMGGIGWVLLQAIDSLKVVSHV